MRRRHWLSGCGAALTLILGPGRLAYGAAIVAVRIWPAQDYTRVTIESDAALNATPHFVADPPRLAVDIEGIGLLPGLRELVEQLRPDDPNVAGIRVGQYDARTVRLVVDLKRPIQPQVFGLEPVAAYGHRLVLDLYPANPPDPLAELIARRLKDAETPSAGPKAAPDHDPIAQWLAQREGGATPSTADRASGAPRPSGEEPSRRAVAKADKPSASVSSPAPAVPARPSVMTERLIIVALDPGHGGEDPGAIGPAGTREKDVVLAIARQLRDRLEGVRINGNLVRTYLTRDGDYFVPLHTRVDKARRVQADLLVSIHADAFYTPQPAGASVYVLSDRGASSAAARWMAQRENQADRIGGVNLRSQDQHVQRTLLDMSTTAQIKDSLKLGSAMLVGMQQVGKLHKPRVEQAGFAVLRAPDIPSVLVETAFISNPDEERRLRNPEFQAQMAEALTRGIVAYFQKNPPLARSRAL